jgi:hypothetical protein
VSGFQTSAHAPTTTSADATHAYVHHQQAVAPQHLTPQTTAAEKTPAIAITTGKAHAATETASVTPTIEAANDPEATHDPTKATPAPDDPQKPPETNSHHPHRPHPKSKKKKAKSSNAILTPLHAPQLALEVAVEILIADANRHQDELTANAPALPAALLIAKRLRDEIAAVAPRASTGMCLVEGLRGRLRGEIAVVIVRGTRRSAGSLIGMFLGVGGRGVGVGL